MEFSEKPCSDTSHTYIHDLDRDTHRETRVPTKKADISAGANVQTKTVAAKELRVFEFSA